MNTKPTTLCEGDIYEIVTVGGKTFEICYGYYEDFERQSGIPIPIYPNLEHNPIFDDMGNAL